MAKTIPPWTAPRAQARCVTNWREVGLIDCQTLLLPGCLAGLFLLLHQVTIVCMGCTKRMAVQLAWLLGVTPMYAKDSSKGVFHVRG